MRRAAGRGDHRTLGASLGRAKLVDGPRAHGVTTLTGTACFVSALRAPRTTRARRTVGPQPSQVLTGLPTPSRICRAEGGPGPTEDGGVATCHLLPALPTQELP